MGWKNNDNELKSLTDLLVQTGNMSGQATLRDSEASRKIYDLMSQSTTLPSSGNKLLNYLTNSSVQGNTPIPQSQINALNELETGVSEETHHQLLNENDIMREYLDYKEKHPNDKELAAYHDWAMESNENREKLLGILRFPSDMSRGKRRYYTGVEQDDGSVRTEGRSLDHWMQDYDLLYPKTVLANP